MRPITAGVSTAMAMAASYRCAPVAMFDPSMGLDPVVATQVFEPTFDPRAAIGCFGSLAPIFLALTWGMELDAARATYRQAKQREEAEYMACLRGEGCSISYEEYKADALLAAKRLEEAKRVRLAAATTTLLSQRGMPLLRLARRRARLATMDAAAAVHPAQQLAARGLRGQESSK